MKARSASAVNDPLPPPPMDLKANPPLYRWLQTIYTTLNNTTLVDISNAVTELQAQVAALQARSETWGGTTGPLDTFGKVGDLYIDFAGRRIFYKVFDSGPAAWAQIF